MLHILHELFNSIKHWARIKRKAISALSICRPIIVTCFLVSAPSLASHGSFDSSMVYHQRVNFSIADKSPRPESFDQIRFLLPQDKHDGISSGVIFLPLFPAHRQLVIEDSTTRKANSAPQGAENDRVIHKRSEDEVFHDILISMFVSGIVCFALGFLWEEFRSRYLS